MVVQYGSIVKRTCGSDRSSLSVSARLAMAYRPFPPRSTVYLVVRVGRLPGLRFR
jgi:hypothetical protein